MHDSRNDLWDLIETFRNGNRREVADELIKQGRMSKAIMLAMRLSEDDRKVLITLLENREP